MYFFIVGVESPASCAVGWLVSCGQALGAHSFFPEMSRTLNYSSGPESLVHRFDEPGLSVQPGDSGQPVLAALE